MSEGVTVHREGHILEVKLERPKAVSYTHLRAHET